MLVGGKADLAEEKRIVSVNDAEQFKNDNNIVEYIETSSKTGENNLNVFETLTKAIIKKIDLA